MPKVKPRILVIDDQDSMLKTYKAILKKSYCPVLVNNGQEALKVLANNPFSLVLLDLMMPQMNGVEVLKKIKEIDPQIEVIMVTAVQDIKSAVSAIKIGAYDYLTKPFEIEDILSIIGKALEKRALLRENVYLREVLEKKCFYSKLVGSGEAMKKLFSVIEKVAVTDSTVLITGESGTGKELVAHAIHKQSKRAEKPLVVVNCAAIPDPLVESELFGHERGAFTGALDRKEGKFEVADGGSIFLDEIGCMPISLQSKLLRVLQDNVVVRVGGTNPLQVDVRLIAATNLDLKSAIEKGNFREDLYYRLNIIPIHLPPLRERKADIPLLLDHFLDKYNKEFNKRIQGFDKCAQKILVNYAWPGNVRELQNLIERIVVLSQDEEYISIEDLPLENISKKQEGDVLKTLKQAQREFEISYLKSALLRCGGNQTKAAEKLGIHRTTLISKMKELGLK